MRLCEGFQTLGGVVQVLVKRSLPTTSCSNSGYAVSTKTYHLFVTIVERISTHLIGFVYLRYGASLLWPCTKRPTISSCSRHLCKANAAAGATVGLVASCRFGDSKAMGRRGTSRQSVH